jgi:hypothetical protein
MIFVMLVATGQQIGMLAVAFTPCPFGRKPNSSTGC